MINLEYAQNPYWAFFAAHLAIALFLMAILLTRPLGNRWASYVLCLAIVVAFVAPYAPELLQRFGWPWMSEAWPVTLHVATIIGLMGVVVSGSRGLAASAVLGAALLWRITDFIQDSYNELSILHMTVLAALAGTRLVTPPPWAHRTPWPFASWNSSRRIWIDDLLAFTFGTTFGVLVCRLVLHGWVISGDEVAYTFQAALFAKLHAYGAVPACAEEFRSYWVFRHQDRLFAQYTPGWPLFMTPFVALRLPWLAGPFSLGLLSCAVGRLGRRAAAGSSLGLEWSHRAAGWVAAWAVVTASTIALNGASRYPHVFEAATFAWAAEALLCATSGSVSRRAQVSWGALLGLSAVLMLSARPADGATLGVGLFVLAVHSLVRGRLRWRTAASGLLVSSALAFLMLVILRLQLGRWFATGYSLARNYYPGMTQGFSWPNPTEYRFGIPLSVSAYCFWPCSPVLAIAGFVAMRGEARRVARLMTISVLAFLSFYTISEFGRGGNTGYPPRFLVPMIVPLSVGTGVALTRLWKCALARWWGCRSFPSIAPALFASVVGLVALAYIARQVYPRGKWEAEHQNKLLAAIEREKLHNAVVFAGEGFDVTPMDLTMHLPLELYPNQDVLVALASDSASRQCVRKMFPNRKYYVGIPGDPIRLKPF